RGFPVVRSPLVTPSTPAVWTHVACSGSLLWWLPIPPACLHPHWVRPRRHAKGCCIRKPTVSRGVTYAVVYIYGCDGGRISPTRCAVIDAALDGRERPHRAYRTPPAE